MGSQFLNGSVRAEMFAPGSNPGDAAPNPAADPGPMGVQDQFAVMPGAIGRAMRSAGPGLGAGEFAPSALSLGVPSAMHPVPIAASPASPGADDQGPLLGSVPAASGLNFSAAMLAPAYNSAPRVLKVGTGDLAGQSLAVTSGLVSAGPRDGWHAVEDFGTAASPGVWIKDPARVGVLLKHAFLRLVLSSPGIPLELPLPDDAGLIGELSPFERGSVERALDRFIARLEGATASPFVDRGLDQAIRVSAVVVGTLVALELVRRRLRPEHRGAIRSGNQGVPSSESLAGFPELPGSWPSRLA